MWRLSIAGVEDLKIHKDAGVQWEHVQQKGTIPGNLSHHKTANFGHSAVVFGGIQNNDDCLEAFEFDTTKMQWSKLKQTGDCPKPCDDHSLAQIDEKSFLIFGGFVAGSRVNSAFICSKNGATLDWKKCGENSPAKPSPRASQSATVYNNKCYVFGGMDEDNTKFGDLWELDLTTDMWKEITLAPGSP